MRVLLGARQRHVGDGRLFSVDSRTGQITVGVGTTLDYEAQSTYSVTVSVSDGKDADGNADTTTDDTITVTIHVTNVEEGTPSPPPPPRGGGGGGGGPPANREPEFTEGDRTARSVAEDAPAGANIGEPVAATDFNRDTLTYSLRGVAAGLFDVDASSGQLLTKAAWDYEIEASYSVIVAVSDGKNANGRPDNQRDSYITVTITVTNKDEAGTVALSSSEPRGRRRAHRRADQPGRRRLPRRLVVGAFRGPDRVDGGPRGGVGRLHAGRRRQRQLLAGDGLLHGRARAGQERAGGDSRARPVERRACVHRRAGRRDTTKRGRRTRARAEP